MSPREASSDVRLRGSAPCGEAPWPPEADEACPLVCHPFLAQGCYRVPSASRGEGCSREAASCDLDLAVWSWSPAPATVSTDCSCLRALVAAGMPPTQAGGGCGAGPCLVCCIVSATWCCVLSPWLARSNAAVGVFVLPIESWTRTCAMNVSLRLICSADGDRIRAVNLCVAGGGEASPWPVPGAGTRCCEAIPFVVAPNRAMELTGEGLAWRFSAGA